MRDVIFWGGTGQARVLNECLFGTDDKVVAVFDNASVAAPFADVPLHVGEGGFRSWMKTRQVKGDLYFLVAVGGQDRLRLHDWLVNEGLLPLTVVHRVAYVASDANFCFRLSNPCTRVRMRTGSSRAKRDREYSGIGRPRMSDWCRSPYRPRRPARRPCCRRRARLHRHRCGGPAQADDRARRNRRRGRCGDDRRPAGSRRDGRPCPDQA